MMARHTHRLESLDPSLCNFGGRFTDDEDEEDEEGGRQGVQDGAIVVQVERAAATPMNADLIHPVVTMIRQQT
jgi:hypothetical protein